MSIHLPQRLELHEVGRESLRAQEWEGHVALAQARQAGIEAAFDRADAYEQLGDFEHALECLNSASALSGGLSAACRAEHARFARKLARQRSCPAGARRATP